MTPEHIYIAIGAALFASLLVAWVWGRRKRKDAEPAPTTKQDAAKLIWDYINWGRRSEWLGRAIDIMAGDDDTTEDVEPTKPAPYAPIAGTGSRPVNPLEERVKALEKDVGKLNDWANGINARLEAVGEGGGWRVFDNKATCGVTGDYVRLWDGERLWACYLDTGEWFADKHNRLHSIEGVWTELHGPQRARIVREFLDWKGAQ